MRHRSCRPPWLRPRTTTVEAADLLARSRMRDLDNQDRQCLDTQYSARFARSSGRQGHTSETNQVGSGHKLLGPRRWVREINRSQTESSSAAWLRWIGLGGSSCRAGPARHIADASPYHIADASTPYRGRQHAISRTPARHIADASASTHPGVADSAVPIRSAAGVLPGLLAHRLRQGRIGAMSA
jgi:hypothetical protein